jgi:RNA polymerase sigma-54 factor
MLSIHQHTEHRQQQALSPRLQRAVWLLQLSSTDFAHEVQSVLGRNPFLEHDEGDGDEPSLPAGLPPDRLADGPELGPVLAADMARAGAADSGALLDDGAVAGTLPDTLGGAMDGEGPLGLSDVGAGDTLGDDGDRDIWTADGMSRQRRSEDGEVTALDLMAWEPTLAAQLHAQIDLLPLPERDAALARVQSLEPAGVAARNVAECLTLQLQAIECPDMRDLARRIVNDHMDILARHDNARLARELKRPVEDIEAVCERIRRLDPRPGWRCGPSPVQYVVPDVVVRKVRGKWTVQLNAAVVPRVRMNRVYAELFQRHRRAEDQALADHLKEARWTLRNVEQRFVTILQVAEAIVERQHRFLDHGPMAMRPLGLKEIADALGLHESTVSRVTNNKYMMTPMGVFELKYFFSRALTTESGKTCSGTALRSLIKDMIEAEKPDNPLSDADIARLLAKQGVRLARRTVTKYRQLLRIDPIERRRGRVAHA